MGSIPFGFILTKIFLKKDIREIGSGNIGATNALRTGNKTIGYSTLMLRYFKSCSSSHLCKNFLSRFFIYCLFVCFFRSCFSNLVKV